MNAEQIFRDSIYFVQKNHTPNFWCKLPTLERNKIKFVSAQLTSFFLFSTEDSGAWNMNFIYIYIYNVFWPRSQQFQVAINNTHNNTVIWTYPVPQALLYKCLCVWAHTHKWTYTTSPPPHPLVPFKIIPCKGCVYSFLLMAMTIQSPCSLKENICSTKNYYTLVVVVSCNKVQNI